MSMPGSLLTIHRGTYLWRRQRVYEAVKCASRRNITTVVMSKIRVSPKLYLAVRVFPSGGLSPVHVSSSVSAALCEQPARVFPRDSPYPQHTGWIDRDVHCC
ncbi:hypothetical protein RRG08_052448 [Elysia crispata]|uniref:Uncharacterized protein n=1 Tax=Elysia crispata TaxID=231223 RepID=A0AAE1E837_9GAST|nr:hypothetical protein RRG08_052448 [Elysia crispata]